VFLFHAKLTFRMVSIAVKKIRMQRVLEQMGIERVRISVELDEISKGARQILTRPTVLFLIGS